MKSCLIFIAEFLAIFGLMIMIYVISSLLGVLFNLI